MLAYTKYITTVPQLLEARLATTPTATAFSGSEVSQPHIVTWDSFSKDVAVAARAFQYIGLEQGQRIIIQLPPCYHWEVLQQAAFRLGVAVVGIDPVVAASKVEPIIQQVEPQLWICRTDCRIGQQPPWKHLSCPVAVVDSLANNQVSLDPHVREWADWLAQCEGISFTPPVSCKPSDPAVIVFTSGTTGQSRGIEYDHSQLIIASCAVSKVYSELNHDDQMLSWLPMSGLFQRMLNLVAIWTGTASCFVHHPSAIFEAIAEHRPTFVPGVPRFFEKLADIVESSPEPWVAEWASSDPILLSGSAPLLPSVQERLIRKGLTILEAYGLSENCVPLCANRKSDFRLGTVGKPVEENEIHFADDGEILVRGAGLFRGYFRMGPPAERFTEDGFYRTGDYGRADADGFMQLLGRQSSLIKTSTGRRIASMAVEAAYGQSPLVEQVVVFGEGRTRLAALVTINWEKLGRRLTKLPAQPSHVQGPILREAITVLLDDMQQYEQGLADYEQVDVFGFLEKSLTVEAGEFTWNFKLRREVVFAHNERFLSVLGSLQKRCGVAQWAPEDVVERPRTSGEPSLGE